MQIEYQVDSPSTTPNPGGQAGFAEDWTNKFIALEGGWNSGKTYIGARKLVSLHLYNGLLPDGNLTGVWSAALAPSFPNAKDYVIPELRRALDECGIGYEWRSMDSEFIIPMLSSRAAGLSKIIVRSAEMPERITGWQVGAAWGDEPARWKGSSGVSDPVKDAFLQLTGRVRGVDARLVQLMFTYTNEGDTTSIYERFRAGRPSHALYRASTIENPAAAEFYASQLEHLSPELKEQYLDGGAIKTRGQAVYVSFDRAKHVDPALEFTDGFPLQLALDFNISPGMHGILGQYDPQSDMFKAVCEFHEKSLDVMGLMKLVRIKINQLGKWRWPELQVFGDATGNARWSATSETNYTIVRQCLNATEWPYRVRVPAANPPVNDRVNAFNSALSDVAGKPHWYCHPSCERLIADLQKMHRDRDGLIDKSQAKFSHSSDAEGYRVFYQRPARARLDEDSVGGRVVIGRN